MQFLPIITLLPIKEAGYIKLPSPIIALSLIIFDEATNGLK